MLKIASGKEPFEYPTFTASNTVHHVVPKPVPVAVPRPVAVPVAVPVYAKALAPSSGAPNSKVIKAVAASNEAKAMKKVNAQRKVADKMEKLESQGQINEAINENVKKEEQKVIEAANKRIAEIHSRKATEATKALKAIESAQDKSEKKKAAALAKESEAVAKTVKKHADKVIA